MFFSFFLSLNNRRSKKKPAACVSQIFRSQFPQWSKWFVRWEYSSFSIQFILITIWIFSLSYCHHHRRFSNTRNSKKKSQFALKMVEIPSPIAITQLKLNWIQIQLLNGWQIIFSSILILLMIYSWYSNIP